MSTHHPQSPAPQPEQTPTAVLLAYEQDEDGYRRALEVPGLAQDVRERLERCRTLSASAALWLGDDDTAREA